MKPRWQIDRNRHQWTECSERGLILLVVLCWLTILFVLVAQILATAHISLQITSNLRADALAEARADAAINRAIFQVMIGSWKPDGAIHLIQYGQSLTEISVENEAGRIDPNVAPAPLMQALLMECGTPAEAAGTLTAEIIEWRSIDLLQSANISAALRYRAAGRDYAPPHRRFTDAGQLELVLGMTEDRLTCLLPHLSVYTRSVPTARTAIDLVVRNAIATAYPYDTPQVTSAVIDQAEVIRVTALVTLPGKGRFRRTAVIRLDPGAAHQRTPYEVLFRDSPNG